MRARLSALLAALLIVLAAAAGCAWDQARPLPGSTAAAGGGSAAADGGEAEASTASPDDASGDADPADARAQALAAYRAQEGAAFDYAQVATYTGTTALPVNDDMPYFSADELTLDEREEYAPLDGFGRAKGACMLVGQATRERGKTTPRKERLGNPTGWAQAFYPQLIAQNEGALYNRSHLVAHALGGSDELDNLVTGTAHMNQRLMQPLEQRLLDLVDGHGCHVLYRVTPIFLDEEPVARGVLVEAQSIEDMGEAGELRLCRWCPNVQPGVDIDYASGRSASAPDAADESDAAPGNAASAGAAHYVFNTNTGRYHVYGACSGQERIADANREDATLTPEEARARRTPAGDAYSPCKSCQAQHPKLFP